MEIRKTIIFILKISVMLILSFMPFIALYEFHRFYGPHIGPRTKFEGLSWPIVNRVQGCPPKSIQDRTLVKKTEIAIRIYHGIFILRENSTADLGIEPGILIYRMI